MVLEYLPTFAQHKSPSFVGKYTIITWSIWAISGSRHSFLTELGPGQDPSARGSADQTHKEPVMTLTLLLMGCHGDMGILGKPSMDFLDGFSGLRQKVNLIQPGIM
jgi:hypothetical protein